LKIKKPLSISVVICAYTESRWDYLVSAVDSLQCQTVPPLELIVVIDHNLTLLKRAQAKFSDVIVVENHQPRGLSGARNSGIAVAKGEGGMLPADVIAFLDDDALAAPNWLEQILVGYEEADVIAVGGAIEPVWEAGKPTWFPEEFNWVVGCTYRGMPQTTTAVRNVIGCNMSFRREAFELIGRFRDGIGRVDAIPVGCEETEFCIRLQQRLPHKVVLYNPQARVYHQVPSKRARFRYFRERCYAEGISKALVSRWVGSGDGLSSEWKYTLHTLPRGVIQGVADALLRRELAGLKRAAAIIAGLVITTTGYLVGTIRLTRRNQAGTDANVIPGGQTS